MFIREDGNQQRIIIGKLLAPFSYTSEWKKPISLAKRKFPQLSAARQRVCKPIPHGHTSYLGPPRLVPLLYVNTSMLECAQTAEHTLTYEHHLEPPDTHINMYACVHASQRHPNNWVRFAGTLSLMCLTFGGRKWWARSGAAAPPPSSIRPLRGFILQHRLEARPRQS